MDKEEYTINYLLNKKDKEQKLKFKVTRESESSLKIDWNSFTFELSKLDVLDFISLERIGTFDAYIITIKEPLLKYKLIKKQSRKELIRFAIPTIISLAALLDSHFNDIKNLLEQLLK